MIRYTKTKLNLFHHYSTHVIGNCIKPNFRPRDKRGTNSNTTRDKPCLLQFNTFFGKWFYCFSFFWYAKFCPPFVPQKYSSKIYILIYNTLCSINIICVENRNLLQETLRELEAVSVLRAKQVASKLNQGNNVPYSDVYDTYAIQESSYRQVKLFIVIIWVFQLH